MPYQDPHDVLRRLQSSGFRRKFALRGKELAYLHEKGLDTILSQGHDLLEKRLAPAEPPNDGKQTPYRNHPIFVAQHATATCCRSCLMKWHKIPKGKALDCEDMEYVLRVIATWLEQFLQDADGNLSQAQQS